MTVTRSQYARRLRDIANPWFDADVAIRHTCTACSARFPISEEQMRRLLEKGSVTPEGQRDREDDEGDARADAQARAEAEAAAGAEAEERERQRAEERARARAEADDVWAESEAQIEVADPAPARATGMWGTTDITGPATEVAPTHVPTTGRVLVGSPTRVGAGRRSGPARRAAGDRAR